MIKGIIFDYDGVLTKRYASAYHMYQWMICKLSNKDKTDLGVEEMVQRCMIWDEFGHSDKAYVLEKMKEHWFKELDVSYWRAYWYDHFDEFQIVSDDAFDVLNKLHTHYKLAILSNGFSHSQHKKISSLNLEPYFDEVVVSGDYKIQKPDTRIFQIACDKLKLSPNETAMVGDTFFTDLSGAMRIGMQPVWYCHERRPISDLNVPIVRDFKEIEQYFLGNQ